MRSSLPVATLLIVLGQAADPRAEHTGTCDRPVIDTLRSSLHLTLTAETELALDRRQLALQDIASLLHPWPVIPQDRTLDLATTHFDSATARRQLLPTAAVRFTVQGDGRITTAEETRRVRTPLQAAADTVLLDALRELDSSRVLSALLDDERSPIRLVLQLEATPSDPAALPLLRVIVPHLSAIQPVELAGFSDEFLASSPVLDAGAADTAIVRFVVNRDGRPLLGSVATLHATSSDILARATAQLALMTFKPARSGACSVPGVATMRFARASMAMMDAARASVRLTTTSVTGHDSISWSPRTENDRCVAQVLATSRDSMPVPLFATLYNRDASARLDDPSLRDVLNALRDQLPSATDLNLAIDSSGGPSPDHSSVGHAIPSSTIAFVLRRDGSLHDLVVISDDENRQWAEKLAARLGTQSARVRLEQVMALNRHPEVRLRLAIGTKPSSAPVADELFVARVPYVMMRPPMGSLRHSPPAYPEALRNQAVQGDVLISVVIDTRGLPDMKTFKVLRSTHPALERAIRFTLPSYQFEPARIGTCPVRMVVQKSFRFRMENTLPAGAGDWPRP